LHQQGWELIPESAPPPPPLVYVFVKDVREPFPVTADARMTIASMVSLLVSTHGLKGKLDDVCTADGERVGPHELVANLKGIRDGFVLIMGDGE